MSLDRSDHQGEEAEKPQPISQQTLGHWPILTVHHLGPILEAVGQPLDDGVVPEKFIYELNVIVERTIGFMLKPDLVRKDYEELVGLVRRYRKLALSLVHSSLWPPQLPPYWINSFESWNAEAKAALEAKKGAPESVMIRFFLPRALGLYRAAFAQDPDTGVTGRPGSTRGGAYRFVARVGD